GALASSFFVFVGPAAIVGHSISGEQAGILRSKAGIVNQHNNGFSFYVQVFIIIPAVLRSYDAVSYKYELTVFQVNFIFYVCRPNNGISSVIQGYGLPEPLNLYGCIRVGLNLY